LELTITSRPDVEGWCMVKIAVSEPEASWSGTKDCLLAREVSRLADWFDAVASGSQSQDHFDTLDNYFGFELLPSDPRHLRVYMDWPFRPLRAQSEPFRGFFREYPITERMLRQAATSLREQLQRLTRESG
jgi:hypothetical protein